MNPNYTPQEHARNCYLNAELELAIERSERLSDQRARYTKEIDQLEAKISRLKATLGTRKAQLRQTVFELCNTNDLIKAEKNAKRIACQWIKKHNFSFYFNNPASIDNEETHDLEDQEVFIDNWQDAMERCRELLPEKST